MGYSFSVIRTCISFHRGDAGVLESNREEKMVCVISVPYVPFQRPPYHAYRFELHLEGLLLLGVRSLMTLLSPREGYTSKFMKASCGPSNPLSRYLPPSYFFLLSKETSLRNHIYAFRCGRRFPTTATVLNFCAIFLCVAAKHTYSVECLSIRPHETEGAEQMQYIRHHHPSDSPIYSPVHSYSN